MDIPRLLNFLLASLISIGLAILPLSVPSTARHASAEAGMQMADMQMSDMSADMPCCPEKQKQSDCQDCLLAICMAKVVQIGPSANGLPLLETSSRALRPLDEPVLAGLARPPPDHPPRTIV